MQENVVKKWLRNRHVLWGLALSAAIVIDSPVAQALKPHYRVVKDWHVAEELREGGHIVLLGLIALLLAVLHAWRWRGALLLLFAAALSGFIRGVVAFAVGRARPKASESAFDFSPFQGGVSGWLHASNMSFPSGHTVLAFTIAACLSRLMPHGRWLFYAGAALVAMERVAESVHFTSDVVAAAWLATALFPLSERAFNALMHRWSMDATKALAAGPGQLNDNLVGSKR